MQRSLNGLVQSQHYPYKRDLDASIQYVLAMALSLLDDMLKKDNVDVESRNIPTDNIDEWW